MPPNLCDTCLHVFPTCPTTNGDVKFGQGDIVTECKKYKHDPAGAIPAEIIKALRADLYDALPVGEVGAFELIKVIKKHIDKLDEAVEAARAKTNGMTLLNPDIEMGTLTSVISSVLLNAGFTRYPAQTMPGSNNEVTQFLRDTSVVTLDIAFDEDEETLRLIKQEE